MESQPQIDRRALAAPRLTVDLLVELSPEDDEEAVYEADAIDLGRGGIGLRAAVLPEVGQRLRCRFEVPGEGEPCEAKGEVVWAHDAGRWSGAFGLRFDDLDPRTADVLERIAPAPLEDPGTPPELRAPRSVKVKLDGVASAIEGELVSEGEVISVEQAMPFLTIGRGAEIAGEGAPVRAVLERVRLRVEDGVPKLVLELAPDVAARRSLDDEQSEPVSGDATIQDQPLDELVARAPKISEPAMQVESRELRAIARAKPSQREAPRVVTRDEADGSTAERPEPPLAAKAREIGDHLRPKLAKAWMATRALGIALAAKAGPLVLRARDAIVALWRALAARIAQRAPKLGAMLGGAPKRRTTAIPAAQPPAAARRRPRGAQPALEPAPGGRGRAIAIGVIASAAVGLAAYGLASGEEAPPEVEIHRDTTAGSWAATAATVGPSGAEAATASVVTTPETIQPLEVPDAVGAPAAPIPAAPMPAAPMPVSGLPAVARAMPEPAIEAGRIPAPSYPTLADRTAAAMPPAPPAPEPVALAAPSAAPAMEFGAPSVERGRTTTLRMSAPILGLEGTADGNGFTVTVRGSLSLDRASPIAASNPAVERAAILNRGDHCVLTIRFVEGRTPAYRVVARGTSLDVTIGR